MKETIAITFMCAVVAFASEAEECNSNSKVDAVRVRILHNRAIPGARVRIFQSSREEHGTERFPGSMLQGTIARKHLVASTFNSRGNLRWFREA